ncbi:hypothetical protein J3459_013537 [Metarhizium acridum]|nr:hypothetical protein J3459_013537 [Metarhizium acridum]
MKVLRTRSALPAPDIGAVVSTTCVDQASSSQTRSITIASDDVLTLVLIREMGAHEENEAQSSIWLRAYPDQYTRVEAL